MLFNMDSTDDTIITPMGTLGAMNPFFSSHDPYPSNDFNRDENLDQYIGDEHFPAGIDLSEFDFSEFEMNNDPEPSCDLQKSTLTEESMFLPTGDDSAIISEESSALLWVGEECTVESTTTDEPFSPPPSSISSASSALSPQRRTKKCHLTLTERKLRKKDQNKAAAEKYRLKKRLERDDLIKRETKVKEENQALKSELESWKFRLEQFKKLAVNVLQIPLPPNGS